MGELDRLNNNMQSNFTEIFRRLDEIDKKQVAHKKDIEYIKKEINGKLDKRIDDKINYSILKEKYKGLVGLIGGIFGGVGFILTVIKFFTG